MPSSVYMLGEDVAFAVTESPVVVVQMLEEGDGSMVGLTLANKNEKWKGRTVWVRPALVAAVAPPASEDE